MSNRNSVIAIGILIGTVAITGVFFHRKNSIAHKESPQSAQDTLHSDEEFEYPYTDCCITVVETIKDSLPPNDRMYYTDCGICFYSEKRYSVGDTVNFCNFTK